MTQPYTDYKYTKKVGAEANETFVFRFGTLPTRVSSRNSFQKLQRLPRSAHPDFASRQDFIFSTYTKTGRRKRDKKAQKNGIVLKTIPSAKLYY